MVGPVASWMGRDDAAWEKKARSCAVKSSETTIRAGLCIKLFQFGAGWLK
jgi:hypothetical protein